jgi:hypothetical protein
MDTFDVGSSLGDVKPPSFPSEQRRYVFLPGGLSIDPFFDAVMELAWDRWTGLTSFSRTPITADGTPCGLCVFQPDDMNTPECRAQVRAHIDAGRDAWEYDTHAGIFRRVERAYFDTYYT